MINKTAYINASLCPHRLLQNCRDDSLNVTVPMRMLDIFSSEKTYLPVIPDANYVASLLEQILHYMVQTGESNQPRSSVDTINFPRLNRQTLRLV